MSKLTFEFQNLKVPDNFENDMIKILENTNSTIKIRPSMGLSGTETLLIAIAGQISSTYIIKLVEYIKNTITEKIQIKYTDKGKTLNLPKDSDKIESIDTNE